LRDASVVTFHVAIAGSCAFESVTVVAAVLQAPTKAPPFYEDLTSWLPSLWPAA
jgi:hypothetical protein